MIHPGFPIDISLSLATPKKFCSWCESELGELHPEGTHCICPRHTVQVLIENGLIGNFDTLYYATLGAIAEQEAGL